MNNSRQIYNAALFFMFTLSNITLIARLDGQNGFKMAFLIATSICLLFLYEAPREDSEK